MYDMNGEGDLCVGFNDLRFRRFITFGQCQEFLPCLIIDLPGLFTFIFSPDPLPAYQMCVHFYTEYVSCVEIIFSVVNKRNGCTEM